MRIRNVIRELLKQQALLGTVVEKSEINIAVDELIAQVTASELGDPVGAYYSSSEVASMFYGVLSSTNAALCCAYMERLKHTHHDTWATVCENFQTETLDTY